MPTPPADELGESATLTAVRRSVQALDADPAARPTSGFRSRGRSALLGSTTANSAIGRSFHSRRLAVFGATILLFSLIAMPALAGQGAIANGVSGAANAVGQMLGNGRGSHDSQDTDGANTTAEQPDNHGADVSAAAHSTPVDGETHDEHVRTVARNNHGHQTSNGSQADSESKDEQESATSGTESGTEDTHGQQVRAVAQDNHGADVSTTAQTTSTDGGNHGEQVKAVAGDNHGADVSAAAQSASTGDETTGESVNTVAHDNHGAEVSAAAQSTPSSGADNGKQNGTDATDVDGNR